MQQLSLCDIQLRNMHYQHHMPIILPPILLIFKHENLIGCRCILYNSITTLLLICALWRTFITSFWPCRLPAGLLPCSYCYRSCLLADAGLLEPAVLSASQFRQRPLISPSYVCFEYRTLCPSQALSRPDPCAMMCPVSPGPG